MGFEKESIMFKVIFQKEHTEKQTIAFVEMIIVRFQINVDRMNFFHLIKAIGLTYDYQEKKVSFSIIQYTKIL